MLTISTPNDQQRFWDKVDITSDCWLWTGKLDRDGYGRLRIGSKTFRAHRVSYTMFKGTIPGGLVIDHLCRVKHCVNPDHLESTTVRINTVRGVSVVADNAKKTHFKRDHLLEGDNLVQYYLNKNGHRVCRTCAAMHSRRWMKESRRKVSSA